MLGVIRHAVIRLPFALFCLLFLFDVCPALAANDLLVNGDFEIWGKGEAAAPDGWIIGGEGTGTITRETTLVKSGRASAKVAKNSGIAIALYQDVKVAVNSDAQTFIFSGWVKSDVRDSVFLSVYGGKQWKNSVPHSGSGDWEHLVVGGTISETTEVVRLHLWVRDNHSVLFDKASFIIGSREELSGKDTTEIQYFTWPEFKNRQGYRSRLNNIAMTFGDKGNGEGYFYENFFVYDYEKLYDYFCIPDDLIIAYNDDSSFRTRAVALRWSYSHGLKSDNKIAFVEHTYINGAGFNPFAMSEAKEKARSKAPPATIRVRHEMYFEEQYVPMSISIRNDFQRPLRFLYVLQDGAYMTENDTSQKNIHQYWQDGEYGFARQWSINDKNRHNRSNWLGLYNDSNGGMFAGLYAPPESEGIRYFATWDAEKPLMSDRQEEKHVAYIDNYSFESSGVVYWQDDWFRFEKLLSHVDTPNDKNAYDNPYGKIWAAVIDFGIIPPGETRSQLIVKIMFTGYKDRKDMHERIRLIIDRIPRFVLRSKVSDACGEQICAE